MISIFLGAGFSAPANVPLASQLFDVKPEVDRISRDRLVDRVLQGWNSQQRATSYSPEEYLANLEQAGGRAWLDAQWYVGLVIALAMGRVELVGMKPTITRHNLDRTTGVRAHEAFWTAIFRKTQDISVLTTNYDILPERGIRHVPRPRVPRPGFHYGLGPELLAGGGYPSYTHIQKISIAGTVPIYKLHGSVSWSYRNRELVRYHDCRPAIRGDAAIVAPVTTKALPVYLRSVWDSAGAALASSRTWLIVGYSLPLYDSLVRELLKNSVREDLVVHVFDPDLSVAERFRVLLQACNVYSHPGLSEGLSELDDVLCGPSRDAKITH
ncbi:MAG: hypothetical protein E6Q61_03995 [Nitrosomonas sp.]|nr:MAG: hypothetical protein E6Q61_03995 [Nitrosomonas sp.]